MGDNKGFLKTLHCFKFLLTGVSDRYKAYMKIFAEVIQKLLQCNKCRGYRGITASHLDRSRRLISSLTSLNTGSAFFFVWAIYSVIPFSNRQRTVRETRFAGLCESESAGY